MAVTINGVSYDHGQLRLEVVANGISTGAQKAFSSISYEDGVERGDQIGANRVPDQCTEGQYSAKASGEFYRNMAAYYVEWFDENSLSWYDTEFQLAVEYWNNGDVVNVDTLPRVMWSSRKFSSSEGTDATKVGVDFKVIGEIFINGIGPFGTRL
jgi:hypothetical protein